MNVELMILLAAQMKDEIEIYPFSSNSHFAVTDMDVPLNLLLIERTSLTKATACSMRDRFVVSICCLFFGLLTNYATNIVHIFHNRKFIL